MANENEPAKLLLPYLQRADELQKHEPLVAYYCRLYAMERGLRIPQSDRTKTTSALLVSLMKQLEKMSVIEVLESVSDTIRAGHWTRLRLQPKASVLQRLDNSYSDDKKSLQLGPEDNLYLEGFALNVFGKADKQDRAGRADLNTAKTFYAASIFFEILNQFGAVQPDLEQKQKYAAWKAADIRKALKEGRKPTAGQPAGDEDLSFSDLGTTENSGDGAGTESDSTPSYHNPTNYQNLPSIPPAPKFHDTLDDQHSANISPSMQFHDRVDDNKHSPVVSPSSHSYTPAVYPSQDYHPPPPSQDYHPPPPSHEYHHPPPSQDYHHPPPAQSGSSYSEPYNHQQYSLEHSQSLGPNYPSHDTPSSHPYPNFQSYPSFTESSLPSVPSLPINYTYYQGSDSSQSAPLATSHSSSAQHSSSSRNGTTSEPKSATQTYQYDSSYQPAPERIAEAHKAARFAVGALAFDDVSIAVDYLRKSLELLTNPSVGQ